MASEWIEAPPLYAGPSGYRRPVAVHRCAAGIIQQDGRFEIDFATRSREVEDPGFSKQVLASA